MSVNCEAKNIDKQVNYVSVVTWPVLVLGRDSYGLLDTSVNISFAFFYHLDSREFCHCFRCCPGVMGFHATMDTVAICVMVSMFGRTMS